MKNYGMVTNKECESSPSVPKGRRVRLYLKDVETDTKLLLLNTCFGSESVLYFIVVGVWHTNLSCAGQRSICQCKNIGLLEGFP